MRSRPNLFIVGAPKAGTTSLAHWLSEHPSVCFSRPKEPWFFSRMYDSRYKTWSAYLGLFAHARNHDLYWAEGSPTYMEEEVVPQVLEACPDAVFIAILRNPVTMAVSLHGQQLKNGTEPYYDFDTAWRDAQAATYEPAGSSGRGYGTNYVLRCRLGTQYSRMKEAIPAERLKLAFYEDLRNDPGAFYRDILNFLGLEDDGRTDFTARNVQRVIRNESFYKAATFARRGLGKVKKQLGLRGTGLGLLDAAQDLSFGHGKASLSPETEESLAAEFAGEIDLLEQATGRDLSDWRQSPFVESTNR